MLNEVLAIQRFHEKSKTLIDLYEKLDEAEVQSSSGAIRITHREVISRLRSRLDEYTTK